MKKRILCGLLAALMLAVSAVPVSAASAASAAAPDTVATTMAALDIMVGDENGELNLSDNITRAQFVKMAIAASPYGDTVGETTAVSPYPDVPYSNWAAPYVERAVSAGLVNGYLDGTFRPNDQITLAEGVTIVLRLLGHTDSDFSGIYPNGQMAKYRALGLDKGVGTESPSAALTRQDAMYLFYNLLTAPTKSGQTYLVTLGHPLTASGEMDLTALVASAMEGPVLAGGDLSTQLGFTLKTVYRAGSPSTLAGIQPNDVVYWSESMRTVWAYTGKVTGVYQSAAPSASAPSSVTVAGKTYSIETAAAAYALSAMGTYHVGDQITLLLGKDGGVAAVLSPSEVTSALYGIVTATGTGTFVDAAGNSYTAKTATLTATDGSSYTYPISGYTPSVGSLVQVTVSDSGTVKLSSASTKRLSGTVNAGATALGSYEFAENIQILDVRSSSEMIPIYPERLSGVALTKDMIRFYATDASGRITHLILNDVTGDMDRYGVVTSFTNLSAGMVLSAIYTYNIAGQSQTVMLDVLYPATSGPFVLRTDGSMGTLSRKVALTSLSGAVGYDNDGGSWKLSDNLQVFIHDGGWYYTSAGYVSEGYTLTGYYDKAPSSGGCIRVIVAEPVK